MFFKNYTINQDLSVDANGSVVLYGKKLQEFPVIFGKISGNFNCSTNYLTTLKGAPREVGGDFYCRGNNLTSLRGSPREVGKDFDCRGNHQLKSLDGIGNVHGQILSDFE
jgi:hypothetical protein